MSQIKRITDTHYRLLRGAVMLGEFWGSRAEAYAKACLAFDALLPASDSGGVRKSRSKNLTVAMEWLADFLRDGPKPAAEVFRESRAAGMHDETIRIAREELGVIIRQEPNYGAGFPESWKWSLPTTPHAATSPHERWPLDPQSVTPDLTVEEWAVLWSWLGKDWSQSR